jgi:hypothetical protein
MSVPVPLSDTRVQDLVRRVEYSHPVYIGVLTNSAPLYCSTWRLEARYSGGTECIIPEGCWSVVNCSSTAVPMDGQYAGNVLWSTTCRNLASWLRSSNFGMYMATSLEVPLASCPVLSLRFQNHWANLGMSLPFPSPPV